MILGLNQPYFLPYIGFWQLVNAVDIFVIADDYNYINKGWIDRNRILINGDAAFYKLEIKSKSQNKKINELYLMDYQIEKKYKQLSIAYGKAPYFQAGMGIMEQIYSNSNRNLASFLVSSMKSICEYLEINTRLVLSSDYRQSPELKREYRVYDFCKRLKCDAYYNAIGGQQLYSFSEFKERNIQLGFVKPGEIRYKQFKNDFVPNLSILDVIMFNPKEKIQEMLIDFTLIIE